MSVAYDIDRFPDSLRLGPIGPAAAREKTPEPSEPIVNLKSLEDALTRNRLDEIAELVRALTYGEMMELAKAIWEIRPNEVEPLTDVTLPGVLHRWSMTNA